MKTCTNQRHRIQGVTYDLPARYSPVQPLGIGSYGSVISAVDSSSNKYVAIKKIRLLFRSASDAKRILREIKIMRHLSHPNILKLCDLFLPEAKDFNEIYLVMPLMQTPLNRLKNLSEDHITYYMYQLLEALDYLHSSNLIHRDLTPSNVLTDLDCNLVIADFGLSRGFKGDEDLLTDYVVTRNYRAPELILEMKYDQAIDIWSAGCIFGFLLCEHTLFPGRDQLHQLETIFSVLGMPSTEYLENIPSPKTTEYFKTRMTPRYGNINKAENLRKTIPKLQTDLALDFICKLLTYEQEKRGTAHDMKMHDYLSKWNRPDENDEDAINSNDCVDRPSTFQWPLDNVDLTEEELRTLFLDEISSWDNSGDVNMRLDNSEFEELDLDFDSLATG